MTKTLVDTLNGMVGERKPVWLMRQAGRYLPEYRKLRKETNGFINFCLNPELASLATLQPLQRFDLDAAILFSDILVIPYALGFEVDFIEGKGPVLTINNSLLKDEVIQYGEMRNYNLWREHLISNYFTEKLMPIQDTIRFTKRNLSPSQTMIGFCGAPWTVATYMIEGGSFTAGNDLRRFATYYSYVIDDLIELLVDASIQYLQMQISAGAEVLQIFDSWCSLLTYSQFERWVIDPTAKIVSEIKKHHQDIKIIGYPRLAGNKYKIYKEKTGVDAVGFDEIVSAREIATSNTNWGAVQGAVDSQALVVGGEALENNVRYWLDSFDGLPHVVNLGHGILPQTPIENVIALVHQVRNYSLR